MTRLIITLGLGGGAMMAVIHCIVATLCVRGGITFDQATLIGYGATVLALSVIFSGIRSYRDSEGRNSISFWKAVQIGLLITLIASIVHSIGFEIYSFFNPEFKTIFLEKFAQYKTGQLPQSPSADSIEAVNREVAAVRIVHENPVFNFVVSLIAILPVGAIITLVSALLLRKKKRALVL